MTEVSNAVDAYIARAPKPPQAKVREIRAIAPGAAESISYGMPGYGGGHVAWLSARKEYISLYLRRIGSMACAIAMLVSGGILPLSASAGQKHSRVSIMNSPVNQSCADGTIGSAPEASADRESAPAIIRFLNVTDPVALKWTTSSNLYVLSGATETLSEFSSNGDLMRSVQGIGLTPTSVDVGDDGAVFIVAAGEKQIRKYLPTPKSFKRDTNFGQASSLQVNGINSNGLSVTLKSPFGIVIINTNSDFAVSDTRSNQLQLFSKEGYYLRSVDMDDGREVDTSNEFKGLCYDDTLKCILLVESGHDRIFILNDLFGIFPPTASGRSGSGLGQFHRPTGIAVNSRGVYVADTENDRIQVFDHLVSQGHFSKPLIPAAALSNEFGLERPQAVAAVNSPVAEMLYIADTGHNRVVLVTLPLGDPAKIWFTARDHLIRGNIDEALKHYSKIVVRKYRERYTEIGTNALAAMFARLPNIAPVFIGHQTAQYRFDKAVDPGSPQLSIHFVKENGKWKLLEY